MPCRVVPLLAVFIGLGLSSRVAIAQQFPKPPSLPAASVSQSSSESQSSPESSESSDDLSTLRALTRHFTRVGMPGDELLVGELPIDRLPESLPLPSDAQLLGSVVRGEGRYLDILLQLNQSPQEFKTFYTEQLADAGWEVARFPTRLWEFTTANPAVQAANPAVQVDDFAIDLFCSSTEGLYLNTVAAAQPGQATTVNLSLRPAEARSMPPECNADAAALPPLPTLQLPDGITQTGGSSADATEDILFTHALIASEMTREDLLAHFAEQYEQAGWMPVEQRDEAGQLSASWTIENTQGQTWQSTFYVLPLQGEANEYLLSAQAVQQGN